MKTLVLALAASTVASAALIYDTAVTGADLTSSRTESSGKIVTGGGYSTDGKDLTIAWDIQFLGGGVWQYKYTISGYSAPAISHTILDLSDDCTSSASMCVIDPTLNGSAIGAGSLEYSNFKSGAGNPGFPAGPSIAGIKFDVGSSDPNVIMFTSMRSPVWGDIYGKGGSSSFFYNVGLTLHATSMDVNDFIARPNGLGGPAIPEPGTFGLMAGAAGLLAFVARRRMA